MGVTPDFRSQENLSTNAGTTLRYMSFDIRTTCSLNVVNVLYIRAH